MALPQDIEDPKFEIVKIGPCSYRKLIVPENLKFKVAEGNQFEEEEEYEEELDSQMVYEGEEWVLRLSIPAVFHRFIIGSQGRQKSQLEMESGARIQVPKREDQDDSIYVRARQKQQIYSCKAQIELLCEREEPKLEYTHFLSLPLAHDAKFRQQVDKFREDVIIQRFPGIDASIFMPSRRMHITLCMLKLHSHAQVEEMKDALQQLSSVIESTADYNRNLTADLRGLHIMTDDPSNVGVVFTTDRSHALQHRLNSVADVVFEILKARGLASQQNLMAQRVLSSDGVHSEVKLHATLMNTKYSKVNRREDGSRGDRDTFDASAMMEYFADVEFGEVSLRELQLSCLDEMGDDGYYRSLFSLPLCNPRAYR
jgi:2'-5' RNA ligase